MGTGHVDIILLIISISLSIIPAFADSFSEAYYDEAYDAKSYYSDALNLLESSIQMSEDALTGIVFENSQAQEKINHAWNTQKFTQQSFDNAKKNWYDGDYYLQNNRFKESYDEMKRIDYELDHTQSYLTEISQNIGEGKKLEVDYQYNNRFCFLFWCADAKNYDWVDFRIKDLDLKIAEIQNIKQSLNSEEQDLELRFQKIVTENKQDEIEKQEQQLKSEKLAKEQKQREVEQKQRELVFKQEQLELEQIEKDKRSILADYSWSPFIMGLTDGELTYYVQPLPSYASEDVRDRVESLASWMDGKIRYGGIQLKRVYELGNSDFSINWVTNYQEEAIGRQVGDHLIIGLGKNNCFNDWMPFDGYTVYKIMWHEVGHALGYDHVSDSNNIMYERGTGTNFDLEYKNRITLPDGYSQKISLCHGGNFYYKTGTNSENAGYKVYVVPQNTDPRDVINGKGSFYLECSAYTSTMKSASRTCSGIPSGSYLLIHNPSSLGLGNPVTVDLEIYDKTTNKEFDMDFDESQMYFSEDFVDYVKTLFRN